MSIELNPYSCEAPGHLFVGFGRERASLLTGLINRRNYALIGGHRCGKTSFLLQMQQDIQRYSNSNLTILPTYANMKESKPSSEGEFFAAIWSSVTRDLEIEGLQEPEYTVFDRNFFALRRLSPLLEATYSSEWLVVLLIDELDSVATGSRSIQFLRRMLLEEPHCRHFRLIATGGSNMAQLTGEGSLLNLEAKYLGPLTATDADQLIEKDLKLKAAQRSEIRELTGRHPYVMQALLGALWETRAEKWSSDRLRRAIYEVTRHRFGSFRRWIADFGQQGCEVYGTLAHAGGALGRKELQGRLRLGAKFHDALLVLEFHGAVEEDATSIRVCGRIFLDWFSTNFEIELPALPPPESNEDRSKSIFVVHGRNDRLRIAMFEYLRALGLHPLEWTEIKEQTEGLNPYIGDILETGFSKAQAVVVMLTGDDEARLTEECRRKYDIAEECELRPQPRPNVLFEAGIAMARFPKATILVQVGQLRGMSDIAGRHLLRMDNSRAARTELAKALQKAGCEIEIERNNRWVDAGNFDIPITPG